jgi:hypothetical protein
MVKVLWYIIVSFWATSICRLRAKDPTTRAKRLVQCLAVATIECTTIMLLSLCVGTVAMAV